MTSIHRALGKGPLFLPQSILLTLDFLPEKMKTAHATCRLSEPSLSVSVLSRTRGPNSSHACIND